MNCKRMQDLPTPSENKDEVALALELFPENQDYRNIYEKVGLVGKKSSFAHCIYLSSFLQIRQSICSYAHLYPPIHNLYKLPPPSVSVKFWPQIEKTQLSQATRGPAHLGADGGGCGRKLCL